MKFAIACCGTLLIFLSSCAKNQDASDPRGAENIREHAMLEGSVEWNVMQVQESEWAHSCDTQIRDIQIEIARELDRRQDEILTAKARPASNASLDPLAYNEVRVGAYSFLEQVRAPAPKLGWDSSYKRSWKDIIHHYQAIKGRATDHEWRSLNSRVKGILLDDVYRVVKGVNYYRNKDSGPSLLALRTLLENCKADTNCVSPNLSAHSAFLGTQPLYTYYLNKLNSLTETAARRDIVERFHWRVYVDAMKYDFRKYDRLIRRDADTFVLPLDAEAYNGVLPPLQRFIESAWSNALGKSVKVEWQDTSLSPGVFRFILHSQTGSRAYVDRQVKTINLFPNDTNKVVAHEIGHVIGFGDTYYSVWDEKNCLYTEHSREDDIMSDGAAGSVLPEHWEKMQLEYPLTTR